MKKENNIFLIAALLVSISPVGIHASKEKFNEAYVMFQNREYRKAIPVFRELLRNNKGDVRVAAEALYYEGLCYEYAKNYTAANKIYHRVRQDYPGTFYARYAEESLKRLSLVLKLRPLTVSTRKPEIGAKISVPPQTIQGKKKTSIKKPAGSKRVLPPSKKERWIRVRKNDTLWKISKRLFNNGHRYRELAGRNGLKEPYRLFVGQKLIVPAVYEQPGITAKRKPTVFSPKHGPTGKIEPVRTLSPEEKAETLYETGMKQYDERDFLGSIDTLRTLLKDFNGTSWGDNAQFLLSFIFYSMRNYRKAVSEYLVLTDKYPRSPLSDDAMAFAGELCFMGTRDYIRSQRIFKDFLDRYPAGENAYGISLIPFVKQRLADIKYLLSEAPGLIETPVDNLKKPRFLPPDLTKNAPTIRPFTTPVEKPKKSARTRPVLDVPLPGLKIFKNKKLDIPLPRLKQTKKSYPPVPPPSRIPEISKPAKKEPLIITRQVKIPEMVVTRRHIYPPPPPAEKINQPPEIIEHKIKPAPKPVLITKTPSEKTEHKPAVITEKVEEKSPIKENPGKKIPVTKKSLISAGEIAMPVEKKTLPPVKKYVISDEIQPVEPGEKKFRFETSKLHSSSDFSFLTTPVPSNTYPPGPAPERPVTPRKVPLTATPAELVKKAKTYIAAGQIERGIEIYRQVIKIAPSEPSYYNNLAYVMAENEIYLDEAELLLKKALTLNPGGQGYYLDTLGWVYYKKGELQKAVKVLNSSLKEKETPFRYYHIGMVYLRLKDNRMARRAFQKAIQIDQSGEVIMLAQRALKYLD